MRWRTRKDPPLAEQFAQLGRDRRKRGWWEPGASRSTPTGAALLEAPPEERIEIAIAAVAHAATLEDRPTEAERSLTLDLAAQILKRKLPFTADTLGRLLDALTGEQEEGEHSRLTVGLHPILPLLGALERFAGDEPLPEPLQGRVERLARLLDGQFEPAEQRRAASRARALLGPQPGGATGSAIRLPRSDDPWTQALGAACAALPDADRVVVDRILAAAAHGSSTRPTKAFAAARDALGAEADAATIGRLCGYLLTTAAGVRGTADTGQLPPELGDLLRGVAWVATTAGGAEAIRGLGAMAEAGWRKVPGWGPLSAKAGSAAIGALARLPDGAPQLGRLRAVLKQAAAVKALDAAIDEASETLGIARDEFEERVVPSFGLDAAGERTERLGETEVTLALSPGGGSELRFTSAKGKPVKSAPKAVREEHGERLAALRQEAKDVKAMVAAQRLRLERLLLGERAWAADVWRARYVEHGLVGPLARRLIWSAGGTSFLPADGTPEDVTGAPVALADDSPITLWHPVDAPADEVRAWRLRLEGLELTQPFKQAHREIYLLTDAERQTRTYSNRFAAHVLRQHQLAALARGRGWRYALQGAWDAPDETAVLGLDAFGLQAELWIERPWDSEDISDAGVFNHVLSEQVRFSDASGRPTSIETVPRRVFSEVMRDVDLFVGVTSIGSDPEWADRGDDRHRAYWSGFAFGDLTAQAEIRLDVLSRLLPRLAIADVAQIDGRFLRVQGRRRAYRIHLGSGNILMEPNDAYLCIVPGRRPGGEGRVYLPFEGDQMLSVILSKALLLARDDEIDDPTIVRQIGG